MNPGRTDARGGIRATMVNVPAAPVVSCDSSGRPSDGRLANGSEFRAGSDNFAGYFRVECGSGLPFCIGVWRGSGASVVATAKLSMVAPGTKCAMMGPEQDRYITPTH